MTVQTDRRRNRLFILGGLRLTRHFQRRGKTFHCHQVQPRLGTQQVLKHPAHGRRIDQRGGLVIDAIQQALMFSLRQQQAAAHAQVGILLTFALQLGALRLSFQQSRLGALQLAIELFLAQRQGIGHQQDVKHSKQGKPHPEGQPLLTRHHGLPTLQQGFHGCFS